MGVGSRPVLTDLLGASHPDHLAVFVFAVLAVPELVQCLYLDLVVEVVDRRRVRGEPLQTAGVPWVRPDRGLVPGPTGRHHHVDDKRQNPEGDDEGSNGGKHVPELEAEARAVGVDTAGHALQPQDVHRAEGHVEANEHQPEVPLTELVAEQVAEDLGPPEVEAGKDAQ